MFGISAGSNSDGDIACCHRVHCRLDGGVDGVAGDAGGVAGGVGDVETGEDRAAPGVDVGGVGSVDEAGHR